MAADVRTVWMPGGVRTEVHVVSEDSGGAFCLLVDHPPAGWWLPAHRHRDHAETIHIVSGDFEMQIDGVTSRLSPGETVHIRRGVIHAGGNVGRHAGRRVVLFSPGGMERFFLEAGAANADLEIEPATVLAAATAHGWEFTAPRR
jgi:quercetin dioxygenase-like cupin family protein